MILIYANMYSSIIFSVNLAKPDLKFSLNFLSRITNSSGFPFLLHSILFLYEMKLNLCTFQNCKYVLQYINGQYWKFPKDEFYKRVPGERKLTEIGYTNFESEEEDEEISICL